MDDMITTITSNHDKNIEKIEQCLQSEFKLLATQQIATRWFEMQEAEELKVI